MRSNASGICRFLSFADGGPNGDMLADFFDRNGVRELANSFNDSFLIAHIKYTRSPLDFYKHTDFRRFNQPTSANLPRRSPGRGVCLFHLECGTRCVPPVPETRFSKLLSRQQ